MQLHTFGVKIKKGRKRVARGGKRGTYSGRGLKGQKSRAGRRIRPAMRDLIARIPKRRGFRNKPTVEKPQAISLRALASLSGTIDLARLKEVHIVSQRYRGKVKIIGSYPPQNPVIIKGILVSKGAKASVEKAGGQVIMPEDNKK